MQLEKYISVVDQINLRYIAAIEEIKHAHIHKIYLGEKNFRNKNPSNEKFFLIMR